MITLECSSCGITKSIPEFPKDARKTHGVGSECNSCASARARAKRRGITCTKERASSDWTCTVCNETKELTEVNFYVVKSRLTNYDNMCRICRNKYHSELRRKEHDSETQRKQRDLNSERQKLKHRALKVKAIEYKGNVCTICDLKYNGSNAMVFDFHHTNPLEKDSQALQGSRGSFEKAKKELDKCVLLCANCHRTVHSDKY